MKNMVIGITGATGSGKSFLAKEFINIYGNDAIVFDQDNYFYSEDEQPVDKNGKPNFDTPFSLDLDKFEQDFLKLINGEKVIQDIYSYNKPRKSPESKKIYLPKKIIIVEGIFALYRERVIANCDITIFVESDFEKTKERRIIRDKLERGYDEEDVLYKFDNHIIESYEKYILPLKNKVNCIFKNNENDFESLSEIISYVTEFMNKKRDL